LAQEGETLAIQDLDDQRLIERGRSGDKEALNALVERYSPRMYRYAYRLTRDYDSAADVVADTFVRALRGLEDFKQESSVSTWLYRILVNSFLDSRKRASNRMCVSMNDDRFFGNEPLHTKFEDPGETPDIRIVKDERSRRLVNAIVNLPEMQRSIITLFHGEGKSYEEIAQIYDLPIGTVKSRLNRARGMLRDVLDCEHEFFVTAS
jgi:RNA polymerase sigma-70 factor (ECF subfamily)